MRLFHHKILRQFMWPRAAHLKLLHFIFWSQQSVQGFAYLTSTSLLSLTLQSILTRRAYNTGMHSLERIPLKFKKIILSPVQDLDPEFNMRINWKM